MGTQNSVGQSVRRAVCVSRSSGGALESPSRVPHGIHSSCAFTPELSTDQECKCKCKCKCTRVAGVAGAVAKEEKATDKYCKYAFSAPRQTEHHLDWVAK
jgi:hypothetical protein